MTDAQKNVLIVDADPVQRRVLADLLASDGHAVLLASDGEEALLRLENGLVDLVFADEILADMSGQ